MAITASGLFVQTFMDALDGTQALNLDVDTHKLALFSGNTPNYGTDTAYNAGNWANTSEITGTNWAAGGVVVTTPATPLTNQAGSLTWDLDDVSVASTTLADSEGGLIYADALTTPADMGIAGIYWGAGDFSTSNGTFAVTWTVPASGGVFAIDMTPGS